MIVNADSRNIPLRDESVQLVITSPPYWGLRDYGTGHWEGGVPFCNHGDPKEQKLRKQEFWDKSDFRNGQNYTGEKGYKKERADYATKFGYADNFRNSKHYLNNEQLPGTGYKKGREDYGINTYPSIGYRTKVKAAGFGSKTACVCGATWIDPAIGLEASLDDYLREIINVFREVRRVLTKDGLLFMNMGDKYEGNQLLGAPWRVALALQSDGWFLRNDIIWAKPNPMPESLSTKRCTTSHEYLFMFARSGMDYYWDGKAIEEPVVEDRHSIGAGYKRTRGKTFLSIGGEEVCLDDKWNMKMLEGGNGVRGNQSWAQYTLGAGKGPEWRNKRDVWTITVEHSPEHHYATFPQALVLPCILAGSKVGDVVFDCFGGTSTVGYVAERLGRRWVTTELSMDYCKAASRRTAQMGLFQ